MGTLSINTQPSNYTSVFLPITIKYAWTNPSCVVFDSNGSLGIEVNIDFINDVSVGSFVQVLNGSYKGSYKVTSITSNANIILLVTDGVFASLDSTSNLFSPDQRQTFELWGGYQSGDGLAEKPYKKIADISVPINVESGLFEINLQRYLRTYFEISNPQAGKDYDISLQWQIKPTSGTFTSFKYSYYSAKQINSAIVGENEPLGSVPVTMLNTNGASDIPTLFSVIESDENTVLNVLTGVEEITTVSDAINVNLASGQAVTVNFVNDANWGSITLDPVLSWVQIVSVVDNILTVKIDTSQAIGGGDYLSADYNDADYLTSGINELVGNFTVDILEDLSSVGTINISIFPVTEIRRICKENALNFAWLNTSGGWNSIALECKYVQGFNVGSQRTYVDVNDVLRVTEQKNIFENYNVTAELLTNFELDLLSNLRTSIQAYLYNDETLSFDIPIVIDSSSFETYGNRQRITDKSASFSFRIANEVKIQTQ